MMMAVERVLWLRVLRPLHGKYLLLQSDCNKVSRSINEADAPRFHSQSFCYYLIACQPASEKCPRSCTGVAQEEFGKLWACQVTQGS
jgi:hypothetical protein